MTKHSNTLTKLYLQGESFDHLRFSFVALFSNLQEIRFSLDGIVFKELQHATFPKLKSLKTSYQSNPEYVMKFLEINGKNLEEFHLDNTGSSNRGSNLAITKFCPNLKKVFLMFYFSSL